MDATKKIKFLFLALTISTCCLLQGCVNFAMTSANVVYHRQSWQHTATDYWIVLQANQALDADIQLAKNSHLNVTSFNQVVLLTGDATTTTFRQRAADIVCKVSSVLRVYNAIRVGAPLTSAQTLQDSWITTKIKSKFIANNSLDPSKIKVITQDGTVYLMGVITRDAADIAVGLARNTSGVKNVVKIFYYVIMPKIN